MYRNVRDGSGQRSQRYRYLRELMLERQIQEEERRLRRSERRDGMAWLVLGLALVIGAVLSCGIVVVLIKMLSELGKT